MRNNRYVDSNIKGSSTISREINTDLVSSYKDQCCSQVAGQSSEFKTIKIDLNIATLKII